MWSATKKDDMCEKGHVTSSIAKFKKNILSTVTADAILPLTHVALHAKMIFTNITIYLFPRLIFLLFSSSAPVWHVKVKRVMCLSQVAKETPETWRAGRRYGTTRTRAWPTTGRSSTSCSPWPHSTSWWRWPTGMSKYYGSTQHVQTGSVALVFQTELKV